ncbi:uncharacterized protein N7483_010227 [Penicillium malachiteum]|uniref:uncharacterized protein n=1 Tax=Penicillium malachiteum TaxID=1324776 RepID=UPI0025471489|nr:uncharacterized protein N7483_010227 [Penicillium malachiteum]KAJ5713046.1 hypothetical protein N7483_010227 [Penicillium malachiteum]
MTVNPMDLGDNDRFLALSPERPPLPYTKGWRFTVQSHVPPPPTPVIHENLRYTDSDFDKLERLSPIDFCLLLPPLPGEKGSNTLDLEIVDLIAVGEPRNCQVFTVKALQGISEKPLPSILLAKVYDPLYFDDTNYWMAGYRFMDRSYTHETLASSENTTYGSYSVDISIETPKGIIARPVRLILIEYIPGTDMQKVTPSNFSQEDRQQIMKNIVDIETSIHAKNILLCDCCPRNIILPESNPTNVKFIDFDAVWFDRRPDDAHPFLLIGHKFLGQYITPLYQWRQKPRRKFGDWVDWDWKPWLQVEFAHTASTITPEIRDRFGPRPGDLGEDCENRKDQQIEC